MCRAAELKFVLKDDFERKFPIVEASKLSLQDEFLKYSPKTAQQEWLKQTLMAGIKAGLKDFRKPAMDPAFKDGKIVYEAGLKPATGQDCFWWREKAKAFMPEKNSRMGIPTEYAAFLGTFIKDDLQEMGYTVSEAWEAVCINSQKLGHYKNSANSKHELETTGSRPIGRFCDLGNVWKILSDDDGYGFLFASGGYDDFSYSEPLVKLDVIGNPYRNCNYGTGWWVMDV